jgi:hypothetical protein
MALGDKRVSAAKTAAYFFKQPGIGVYLGIGCENDGLMPFWRAEERLQRLVKAVDVISESLFGQAILFRDRIENLCFDAGELGRDRGLAIVNSIQSPISVFAQGFQ